MAAKRRNQRGDSPVRWIVLAVSVAVLLLGLLNVGAYTQQNRRIRDLNSRVEETYRQARAREAEQTASPEPDPTQTPEAEATQEASTAPPIVQASPTPAVPVSAFVPLLEQNPDTIGWITAGGNVDYPLLWRDNDFYMDHDFFGGESVAGSIFLDELNHPDLSDGSLLVYGHNMRTGDMFGDLDLFRSFAYLKQHPVITLRSAWDDRPRQYAIFAIFDASMNEGDSTFVRIRQFDFSSDAEKEGFIRMLTGRSIFGIDVDVRAEDQLLGLVTCSYSQDNGRLMIYARALRDGETEASVESAFSAM